MSEEPWDIWFDGSCEYPQGPGAGGAVIVRPDGSHVCVWRPLERCTSNVAEYTGLVIGLVKAIELGAKRVTVRGDSKLVIEQCQGHWRVKSSLLKPFSEEVKRLQKWIHVTTWAWVPRTMNHAADRASRGIGAKLMA